MMSSRSKILLAIIMLLGYFLITTSRTSADIFDEEIVRHNFFDMSTLAFSQRHTANGTQPTQLFNIFQLQPQGYDIEAIRIKKEGELDFQYRLTTVNTTGSEALCDALEAEILYDRGDAYEGILKSLSVDKSINADHQDDWIMFLKLNNNNANLKNQQCDFQFKFKTWRGNTDDQSGFWDETVLTNTVTTGIW